MVPVTSVVLVPFAKKSALVMPVLHFAVLMLNEPSAIICSSLACDAAVNGKEMIIDAACNGVK